MNLLGLSKSARSLVDERFLRSHDARIIPQPGDVYETTAEVDSAALNELIRRLVEKQPARDPEMDADAAVELHRVLRISRRDASDKGIWHHLAAVRYPELVRHRWGVDSRSGSYSRERFLGDLVRNTFARLWWGAELTAVGSDYSKTRLLFSSSSAQDHYEALFGRAFSRFPPAARGFVSVMSTQPGDTIRKAAKKLTHVLTTVTLECLNQDEFECLVKEMLQQSTAG